MTSTAGAVDRDTGDTRALGASVSLTDVEKRFGGVRALRGVSVAIQRGTVHAVVGENGAGKSTLGRVIAGVLAPDGGELRIDGEIRQYRSPRAALQDGITVIEQEFNLLPSHTVVDNVFLGTPWARRSRSARLAQLEQLTADSGLAVAPNRPIHGMRVAEQQQVEILRALARDARLIVMDEPTAALGYSEAQRLLEIVTGLRARGVTVVYVSHHLDEVLSVADHVSALRDGRLVADGPAASHDHRSLVRAMLGRELESVFPSWTPPPDDAPVRLEVQGMSAPGTFEDVSFTVRAGEIVGIAGLIGSGRSELAHAIVGADRAEGNVRIDGKSVRIRRPGDALRHGIALLPESRKEQGLLMQSSVADNITVGSLSRVATGPFVRPRRRAAEARAAVAELDIRPPDIARPVRTLSGGNQQKVLFAKCLFTRPRVLIVDEPTRGVDVGAKRSIYGLVAALASDGCAVLMISSELEEVVGMSHRVLVMRRGRLVRQFDGRTTEEDLLTTMLGVGEGNAPPEGVAHHG